VLKHRETYEIMRAEDVGWNANKLTLGKLSGRNALRQRFAALNIEFDSEDAFNAHSSASRNWRIASTRFLMRTCRRW